MSFDIRTIALCVACSNAVLLATLWAHGRSAPLDTTARLWVAARLVQLVGWSMVVLRGSIPDALSIVVANLGLMAGLALEMGAAWSLLGLKRWRQVTAAAIVLGGALFLLALLAGVGVAGRIVLLSSVLGAIYLLTGAAFLARREPASTLHTLMAGTNLAMAGVAALRAYWAATAADVAVFQSSLFQFYAFMGYFALMHFNAFGFLMLSKLGADRELQRAATRDPLTGALNRRGFLELAAQQWAQSRRSGRPLALLMIDADGFKQVNDQLGHAVGDRVLALLSHSIQDGLRASDSVARLGGDEFVALLGGADAAAAGRVAERIRAQFQAATAGLGVRPVATTVSIGVAVSQPGDAEVADVLRRADARVYQAKQQGGNRVCGEAAGAAGAAGWPASPDPVSV